MSFRTLDAGIAVVGAGPAGARAAELLAGHGADVVLLDPRAPWEKPCGGGLSEATFRDVPELEELRPLARDVWHMRVETDAAHGFTVPLARPVRVVPRTVLARWQLDRALGAGVSFLEERVRWAGRSAGRWRIETDERTVRAGLLVGADGAASLVRRLVAPKFRVELAPTRVSLVPGAGPTPDSIVLRFFPGVAGYVWDFPRIEHRSVGVGLQAGGWRRPRMDAAVDAFRRASEACMCHEDEVRRGGAVIGTAQLGHGDFSRVAGDDFALLGDAAGFADPLTGEGIRNALRSAELVAAAWVEDGTFDSYPGRARGAFGRGFEIGRILRRLVFETEAGARILGAAGRSIAPRALVATLADAVNEHDGSASSFLGRWWRSARSLRREPSRAPVGARYPAPCGCGCAAGDAQGKEPVEPTAGAPPCAA